MDLLLYPVRHASYHINRVDSGKDQNGHILVLHLPELVSDLSTCVGVVLGRRVACGIRVLRLRRSWNSPPDWWDDRLYRNVSLWSEDRPVQ